MALSWKVKKSGTGGAIKTTSANLISQIHKLVMLCMFLSKTPVIGSAGVFLLNSVFTYAASKASSNNPQDREPSEIPDQNE